MLRSNFYLAIPLYLVLAIVQVAVLYRFPIFGVTVQLFLIVLFLYGMVAQRLESAVTQAFIAGIMLDLFSLSPVGARSIGLIVAIIVIYFLRDFFPRNSIISPFFLGVFGTLSYLSIYLMTLLLVGQGTGSSSPLVWLPYILFHAALMVPAFLIFNTVRRIQAPYAVPYN